MEGETDVCATEKCVFELYKPVCLYNFDGGIYMSINVGDIICDG